MATDPAQAWLSWLQTSSAAASFRAVVYGGIVEAGVVDTDQLRAWALARQTAGTTTKILCCSIQDAGDEPLGEYELLGSVLVRFFDLQYGYTNIRNARDVFKALWAAQGETLSLDNGGLVDLAYAGRTGHRRASEFGADYEVMTYTARIMVHEGE